MSNIVEKVKTFAENRIALFLAFNALSILMIYEAITNFAIYGGLRWVMGIFGFLLFTLSLVVTMNKIGDIIKKEDGRR